MADTENQDQTQATADQPKADAPRPADNVRSLGKPGLRAMLHNQRNVMLLAPVNSGGEAVALVPGEVPVYHATPGLAVTLHPTIDKSGLSCGVSGVPGVEGEEIVTATYKNPDGTIATGVCTYRISRDPLELDVAGFDVTTTAPVAQ